MNLPAFLNTAEKPPTPCYFFEEQEFCNRVSMVQKALGETIPLCFSIKANPFLLAMLPERMEHVEVCSPGELSLCQRAGIAPERIIYSGVMKEKTDIRRALTYGAGLVTAESRQHVLLIEAVAEELNLPVPVKILLRLTSGNQFGMDEEVAEEMIRKAGAYPHLSLTGIHFYSGTQKKKAGQIEKDLQCLDGFLEKMKKQYHYQPTLVEYGTGLAANYFHPPYLAEEEALLSETAALLHAFAGKYPLSVEMGRFLAATCGTYVTQIMDVKTNAGISYLICDGGIHQLKYYGQTMSMQIPPITLIRGKNPQNEEIKEGKQQEVQAEIEEEVPVGKQENLQTGKQEQIQAGIKEEKWAVCGSLCTVADVLVREVLLPDPQIGDYLAFGRCGAYSVTEGSLTFLSRALPRIYLVRKGRTPELIRDFIPSDLLNGVSDKGAFDIGGQT